MYIYTMEYYSAMKKKEISHSVIAWMDLEDIMLSETTASFIVRFLLSYYAFDDRAGCEALGSFTMGVY